MNLVTSNTERVHELMNALAEISPLPDDGNPLLTAELLEQYCMIVDELYNTFANQTLAEEDCWLIPRLIHSFGSGTAYGCAWSVRHILERFSGNLLRPYLSRALAAEERGAREWSAYLLGIQRNIEDLPALVQTLHDPEAKVRASVVRALGMIGDLSVRSAMEELLTDPDDSVCKAAIESVENLLAQHSDC